jgi:cobalt transporter subunit CbtA
VFRAIVLSAVVAGIIGGVVATAAQSVRVTPLIREAEIFEAAVPDHGDGHGEHGSGSWTPEGPVETLAATAGANVLAGIGFALLITAAMALHQRAGWYAGLLWGFGGFASFTLAPAAGLPPDLPGMATADVFDRQVWWIGTAVATAAGLGFIFLVRRLAWAALGAVLVVAPHLVGAPRATGPGAGLPDDLIVAFGVATLVTNLLFWSALGIAAGILYQKLRLAD